MTSWTPGWGSFPAPLLDFWTERHLCTLTTLRADGSPHVVPVGVALDHEQGCAWVISSGTSHKIRHLDRSGAASGHSSGHSSGDSSGHSSGGATVAACQVDGARWSTLEGVAEVVRDPDGVARAVERYASRYRTPRVNPERVAVRIEVTRFLGSASLLG